MENFADFNIPQWLKDTLTKMGYVTPTPIQKTAIPHVLEGKDVLGTAQTGTGKTGAFLIPLIAYLEANQQATALILTPTRELATQVHTVARDMLSFSKRIKSALLIGGDSMQKQFMQLRLHPRLIVGTPGRINDHLNRRSVNLSKASFVVLDETDRMLDMGFGVQIDEIFQYTPEVKQTLLFSATLPKEILRLVDNYLKDPIRVSAGEVNVVAKNVSQEIIKTKDKAKDLDELLEKVEGTSIIFVRTQRSAESVAHKLREKGHRVEALHGGLKQGRRTSIVKDFRGKRFNILVATDVASRGLDIPHISNVINYDVPDNPEDYIHRIGRTARGDSTGKSFTFVSGAEEIKWKSVQRFLNPEEYKKESSGGSNNNRSRYGRSSKPFGNFNSGGGNRGGHHRDDGFKSGGFKSNSGGFRDNSRPYNKGHSHAPHHHNARDEEFKNMGKFNAPYVPHGKDHNHKDGGQSGGHARHNERSDKPFYLKKFNDRGGFANDRGGFNNRSSNDRGFQGDNRNRGSFENKSYDNKGPSRDNFDRNDKPKKPFDSKKSFVADRVDYKDGFKKANTVLKLDVLSKEKPTKEKIVKEKTVKTKAVKEAVATPKVTKTTKVKVSKETSAKPAVKKTTVKSTVVKTKVTKKPKQN